MKFEELATYFEKLEETSSRLTLIEILSELFKKTPKEEIGKVTYLLQGRVAPFFSPTEIGMADKNVAASLALAFGESKEDILKLYNKLGDMGKVAQQLAGRHPGKSKTHPGSDSGQARMTVNEVFETLTELSHIGGAGSVEKKQTILSDLLKQTDSIGAKHLVRIPLGNTRLGIGDPTVLDALATTKLGDKTKRKLLEKAYNETSDLGLIATTLWEKGLPGVQKLGVTVGRPIRSELCERLPNPTKVFEKMLPTTPHPTPLPEGEGIKRERVILGVQATPKYDGFRVQIHKNGQHVNMYSRNLEDMTHMFPELIEGTLKQIKAKTAILDSEALAYNAESEEFLPFQETTKRRRKHNIEEVAKQLPLKAFVFDILYLDGKSLLDMPLMERMDHLKKTIHGDDILIPAPGKILKKPEEMQLLLDDSISKGLEGVVAKRVDSPYEAGGRNFNWVKLKRHSSGELNDTIDCVILGYIFGKGKRTDFGAGSLLVGLYDKDKDAFVTVTRIGTGLSDDEWREIKVKSAKLKVQSKPARVESLVTPSVWVQPKIVIEVLADEITRSPMHTAGMNPEATNPLEKAGYALRFPRLIKFRDADKKAEDATTVKELIKMYQSQGKH